MKLAVVAGEASGDLHASEVVRELLAHQTLSHRSASLAERLVVIERDPLDAVGLQPRPVLSKVGPDRTDEQRPAGPPAGERNRVEVDAFVIYTDNETWAGDVQPMDALKIQELPSLRKPILIAAFAGWRM